MRYYSNLSKSTFLQEALSVNDTTVVVDSPSGFPTQYPFTLHLELDNEDYEIVEVTNGLGTTSSPFVVTRGIDNTSAKVHSVNARVDHGVSARDFREAQEHIADTSIHGSSGNGNNDSGGTAVPGADIFEIISNPISRDLFFSGTAVGVGLNELRVSQGLPVDDTLQGISTMYDLVQSVDAMRAVVNSSSAFGAILESDFASELVYSGPTATQTAISEYAADKPLLAVSEAAYPSLEFYVRAANHLVKVPNTHTPNVNQSPIQVNHTYRWNEDGSVIGFPYNNVFYSFARDGSTMTPFPNLTLPGGIVSTASNPLWSFSPDGSYVIITQTASPYVVIYYRSGMEWISTGAGLDQALPGVPTGLAWHPNGSQVVFSVANSTDNLLVYTFNGSSLTRSATSAPVGTTTNYGVVSKFSPDGKTAIVTRPTGGSQMWAYDDSTATFTPPTASTTLDVGVTANGVWSPDSNFLAIMGASAYILYRRVTSNQWVSLDVPTPAQLSTAPTYMGEQFYSYGTIPASMNGGAAWSEDSTILIYVSGGTSNQFIQFRRSGDRVAVMDPPRQRVLGGVRGFSWR